MFEEISNDSSSVKRLIVRLKKGLPELGLPLVRDAFVYACGRWSQQQDKAALEVFQYLSTLETGGDQDKALYSLAAHVAASEIAKEIQCPSENVREILDYFRELPRGNILQMLHVAKRNCPPPSMGWRSDVSAIALVIALANLLISLAPADHFELRADRQVYLDLLRQQFA